MAVRPSDWHDASCRRGGRTAVRPYTRADPPGEHMTDTATRITSWSDQALEQDLLDSISLDAPWPTIERFAHLVRLSGSEEERAAVDDLRAQLTAWGVPHTLHEPVCFISLPLEASVRIAAVSGRQFRAKTTAMSVSTDGRDLAGEL